MTDENLKEKIRKSVKTVVPNKTPMNDTRFTLVEILIECDSDRDRSRCFRKIDSDDYIVSSMECRYSMGDSPFGVTLNINSYDFLDYDWYEVTSLYA